jgi:adenylylsulfate kinase
MSGSGKSTLATYIEDFCKKRQYKVYIVDGDEVRDKDVEKLGFDREDVLKNNLRIAKLCLSLKDEGFNIVLVPVISPYEEIRNKVRSLLGQNLHLVYVKTDIDTLKKRDTKGLYAAAAKGVINDLIGYSDVNPYDEPDNAEIVIDTGRTTFDQSRNKLLNYIEKFVCT